jgi:hypothetical protein
MTASAILPSALTQIELEYLPGTAAQFGQQGAAEHKIDPRPFGDGKHPLAVGHLFEHLAHKPLTEGHHPFVMARRAKVAPLARKRQQVLMPALITAHPGKTAM